MFGFGVSNIDLQAIFFPFPLVWQIKAKFKDIAREMFQIWFSNVFDFVVL